MRTAPEEFNAFFSPQDPSIPYTNLNKTTFYMYFTASITSELNSL